jgi:transposase
MGERSRAVKAATIEKQVLKELSGQLTKKAITRVKRRLKALSEDVKAIENEVKELIISTPKLEKSYNLLQSITGIALVNATMMILCTNNFEGITNARSFACYCGVAPFEYTSGTSIRGKTKVSHLANKKMKTDLTNAARSAVVHDPEMRIYYKRKRAEGKAYGTVMNAVKFKIITRVFAVIKRGTPFVKLRQAG